MGTNATDLFGGGDSATPAEPGTYGEPPAGYRLPDRTSLGPVRLQVTDLRRSLEFYQGTLGLEVIHEDGTSARLAAERGRVLVELVGRRGGVAPPPRGRLGLYHFAILLPDRAALGRLVRHLSETGASAGAADHLVSEALYLNDPDGLGIEVYADRPRETWRRAGRELMLATDPLDVPDLLLAAGDEPWRGMPPGTVIGHVHLHVADLAEASAFYSDAVGFDRMTWSYPGALFFGAGGYHHHLGTNTWAGRGAKPPAVEEARLLEWTVELPDAASLGALRESLTSAGFPADHVSETEAVTRDPWGTQMRLRLRPGRTM